MKDSSDLDEEHALLELPAVPVDRIAMVLARDLPHTELGDNGRFLFAGPNVTISGIAREGVVHTMEVRVSSLARASDDDRDLAVSVLLELGSLQARFAGTAADAVDLLDELAVRTWLGLPPPASPEEALARVAAALSRGERPPNGALRMAAFADGIDELLDALAEQATGVSGLHIPNEAIVEVPVGTHDRTAHSAFAMSFDGYAVLGGALSPYANRMRQQFRDRGIVPRTITGARACLFFECRRRVHQGRVADEADWRYLDALLKMIGARVYTPGCGR